MLSEVTAKQGFAAMSNRPEENAAEMPDDHQFPEEFHQGDCLDWNSERVSIELSVELPFWLLVPNGALDLKLGDCTVRAKIINDGVQYVKGHHYVDSGQGTLYLGSAAEAVGIDLVNSRLPDGVLARHTKTLVVFETTAHADPIKALEDSGRRRLDGLMYFSTMVLAHIDFLNLLINSYRHVTTDPFAMEVTAWDVPTWFVTLVKGAAKVKIPIATLAYPWLNQYPNIPKFSEPDKFRPYYAASIGDIEAAVGKEHMPGEVQLLDGWAQFFRGRHADSILSFVTAIEVLLEDKLRGIYKDRGLPPEAIEQRIFETRNKFQRRLEQYCELTNTHPPGPILYSLPSINGVRLFQELESTRRYRHEIVHSGLRLGLDTNDGPMRRVVETATWLFDWLAGRNDFARRQHPHYSLYNAFRGGQFFDYELGPDGVIISRREIARFDPGGDEESGSLLIKSIDTGEISTRQFWAALGGRGVPSDLELFAKMAFAKLRIYPDVLQDSPLDRKSPLPHQDRFRLTKEGVAVLIFLIDREEYLEDREVEQIAAAVTARTRAGLKVSWVLCIVNDQRSVQFEHRHHHTISERCRAIAEACGIGLVKAEDLARMALAVRELGWAAVPIVEDLFKPGRNGWVPPGAVKIGEVVDYYARPRAAIILLNGEVEISIGDVLAFRLRKRFFQHDITSMEQNDIEVVRARYGEIGVVVSLEGEKMLEGCDVFRIPRPPAPPETVSSGASTGDLPGILGSFLD